MMQIRRILVPVDGSELSLQAGEAAAELANQLGASITLLTVVEPPEATVAYIRNEALKYVRNEALDEVRRGARQAAEAMLEEAAERVRSLQTAPEKRLVWGAPAPSIAAVAKEGYQLIVMGSRGLGLPRSERYLLGSVAERVLRRSHCPVLIIPAEEE